MKYSFLFLAASFFLFSCGNNFKTTPSGLKYKLFEKGNGIKPKQGDILKFNFVIKNSQDSIIESSIKEGEPGLIRLGKPQYKGDPMEGFALMAKGDSAVFMTSADSFFKGRPKKPFKPGTMLKVYVKMLDEKPYADYMKDIDKQIIKAQQEETIAIEKYVKLKYPKAQKTASGMYYEILKPGKGAKADTGKLITVHYKGSFITGEVFDTDSGKPKPYAFKLGGHIRGWDEGMALLNKGAKAVFIMPSRLGYGPQGNQRIPPNATLVFEVEVVEVK